MATSWEKITIQVGDHDVEVVTGGNGPTLLVLHGEVGFPGWLHWHEMLAEHYKLMIPLQPGYGHSDSVSWIASYRDVGVFYARMLREQETGPVDVLAFSAGAYIAAEMAVGDPDLFRKMVLVAPLGVRPDSGEIFDFLAVTVRAQLDSLVSVRNGAYAEVYGGDMTADQYEQLEGARAETARLGWEPFMFNPSLPHLLEGAHGLPTLLLWGDQDQVCPRGCVEVYQRSIPGAETLVLPGIGHSPELEDPYGFVGTIDHFLSGVIDRFLSA